MIKQIAVLVVLFFALTVAAPATATDPSALITSAEQAYTQGDYQGAISGYKAALDAGLHNGWLYYNLGNAEYKAGELAQAIANYQLAAKYLPGSAAARTDLELARSKLSNNSSTENDRTAVKLLPEAITRFQLLLVALVANLICWLGLLTRVGGKNFPRWAIATSAGLTLYSLSALVLSLPRTPAENLLDVWRPITQPLLVVTAKGSALRAVPETSAQVVRNLTAGFEARSDAENGGWYRIALDDGRYGWIESGLVARIDAF